VPCPENTGPEKIPTFGAFFGGGDLPATTACPFPAP